MMYLIGVNHGVQHKNPNRTLAQVDIANKFYDYLKKKVKVIDIELVAEEFSKEAAEKSCVEHSSAEDVARQRKIQHLYCDPNSKKRLEKGIGKNDDEKREAEWLSRLGESTNMRVLFICGQSHIASFSELLSKKGIPVEILSEKWGMDEFEPRINWNN